MGFWINPSFQTAFFEKNVKPCNWIDVNYWFITIGCETNSDFGPVRERLFQFHFVSVINLFLEVLTKLLERLIERLRSRLIRHMFGAMFARL
jgi:hypothetical protein